MFKINDRVKVIVPQDKDKAILQDNYFAGWETSAVGKIGTVLPNVNGKDPKAGDWIDVKFDEPPKPVAGYEYEIMGFPEWELELVED